MSRFLPIAALATLALTTTAQAAPDSSPAVHKPSLSAKADDQLRQADVPSASTDPARASVAAQAQADMAARDARTKGPRLQVQRQNLKEDDAARALQQQTTPNTIDRATAIGDKDHTEQVTNLKVTLKK